MEDRLHIHKTGIQYKNEELKTKVIKCPARAVALRAGDCIEQCHSSSLAVVTMSALAGS